jgi:RNA polymerase sigma-70 factor (ECF subfamily)
MKTDAQLIQEARNDPDAFAELYGRHATAIHRWFRARAPESIAVELTAETFAQAALSLRRFRDLAAGSAGPWLYGIARNLLGRYAERERVETRARERLGVPIPTHDDLERVHERERATRLRPALAAALATLPAGQRDAVRLRVVADLPYEQIARELGCSPLAARLRVLRALGSLKRALKGDET